MNRQRGAPPSKQSSRICGARKPALDPRSQESSHTIARNCPADNGAANPDLQGMNRHTSGTQMPAGAAAGHPAAGRRLVPFVLALLLAGAGGAFAQSGPAAAAEVLPFAPGETLEYRVQLGSIGGGKATMRIAEPERVRGITAWPLISDLRAKVVIAIVKERARSWLDPRRMASLRYEKRESSPLSSFAEQAEIFPDEHRWSDGEGGGGRTLSDAPVDELSMIYLIRTLPLKTGDVYSFQRHFDPGRNPAVVRVLGRERVSVPAGTFEAVVVEMEVTDPRRFSERGTIRFHLSDDSHRLPVRIESSMPVVGRSVLSLAKWRAGNISEPQ